MEGPQWGAIVVGLVVAGVLAGSFWFLRRARLIHDTPTSKVKGVFMGLNELEGLCRSANPLISDFARQACVHTSYTVEEHYRRTKTVRSNGKTETKTETGWETVDSGTSAIPFELEDDTGRIWVTPDGAKVFPVKVFDERARRGQPLYHHKAPNRQISGSTGERRIREECVPVDTELYLLGPARLRDDVVAPEIREDSSAGPFIISTKPGHKLARRWLWASLGLAALAVAGSALIPVLWANPDDPSGVAVAAFPIAIALAVVASWVVSTHNSLVNVRERERRAWSLIDVQLRRRHDLIPALVATVQGYAHHEQRLQTVAAEARSGAMALPADETGPEASTMGTEVAEQQTGALRSVFAVAEAYPELKADEAFRNLQAQLIDTEDRIAMAREFFNSSVQAARDRAEAFPASLVAAATSFRAGEYFEPEGFERSVQPIEL